MTNKDVVDLRVAGLDDENLIAAIKSAKAVKFDLSPAGLKALLGAQGVESRDHRDARAFTGLTSALKYADFADYADSSLVLTSILVPVHGWAHTSCGRIAPASFVQQPLDGQDQIRFGVIRVIGVRRLLHSGSRQGSTWISRKLLIAFRHSSWKPSARLSASSRSRTSSDANRPP